MRLIVTGAAIVSVLVNNVDAGIAKMTTDLSLLVARNSSLWSDRSITNILSQFPNIIENYGCWCFFDDNHGKGKGRPVNDIDKICKETAHAYDCAIMDAENDAGQPSCTPWTSNYISGISQGLDGLVSQCDTNNVDPCANAACKIEGRFVLSFFSMFLLSGNSIDPTYQDGNAASSFDPVVDCLMTPGQTDKDRECCGEQPHRYKFKPFNGGNACCGSTVYPTMIQQCCPDNVPRVTC